MSPADRLRGFGLLGVQVDNDLGVPEVSYRSVDLDADPEPESILAIAKGNSSTAYVFDRQSGAWWIVGEFVYWWHWQKDQAERLIALQPLVSDGMDILIRIESGGTGVRETVLSLYHLLKGRLYRTFKTTEATVYEVHGADTYVEERAEIEMEQEKGPTVLIVRRRSETTPKVEPVKITTKHSCAAWRWNAAEFRFVPEPAASARALCAASGLTRTRLH